MVGNKRTQKKGKGRSAKRANTDGFFSVHVKQAKSSFGALWRRPLGNILTLAVISVALAMPLACICWVKTWRVLRKTSRRHLK